MNSIDGLLDIGGQEAIARLQSGILFRAIVLDTQVFEDTVYLDDIYNFNLSGSLLIII